MLKKTPSRRPGTIRVFKPIVLRDFHSGHDISGLSTPRDNAALEHLCAELTANEKIYPGTELRLIYKKSIPLISAEFRCLNYDLSLAISQNPCDPNLVKNTIRKNA
jgi:hypothetical protein